MTVLAVPHVVVQELVPVHLELAIRVQVHVRNEDNVPYTFR